MRINTMTNQPTLVRCAAIAVAALLSVAVVFSFGRARADEQSKPASPGPIAVCDVQAVVSMLLGTQTYKPALQQAQQLAQNDVLLGEGIIQNEKKQVALTPDDDPKFDHALLSLVHRQQVVAELNARSQRAFEDLRRSQRASAYATATRAVAKVAQRKGFAFVVQSSNPDIKMVSGESDLEHYVDLLGRVMVVFPAEVDITADVLAECRR